MTSMPCLPARCAVFIFTLLLPRVMPAQNAIERFAGCYRLEIGPWTPAWGTSMQFHTPPVEIQLLTDSAAPPSQKTWRKATPVITHAYSGNRARASWTASDSGLLQVVWSDGFTGADLRLFERGYGPDKSPSFWGVVQALSDAVGPIETVPKATVVAWRIDCK